MEDRKEIQIKYKPHYSLSFILYSTFLCRLSGVIESSISNAWEFRKLSIAHGAFVSTAIFSAVSFLEATINELFDDAVENKERFDGLLYLDENLLMQMEDWWITKGIKAPTLEKYQKILKLADKSKFNKGTQPYQDVKLVTQLRNSLVHYKPEWSNTVLNTKLEVIKVEDSFIDKLKGKFELCPFVAPANAFFPDKCLGYGCAKWAIDSILKFTDEFLERMAIRTQYALIRYRLTTTPDLQNEIDVSSIMAMLRNLII